MPADVYYRCGVTSAPSARGVLSRWGLKRLTYRIESRPTGRDFGTAEFDRAIADGFAEVSAVCGLAFERTEDEANIYLRTGRGRRSGFDGSSGVLAWCELPPSDRFAGQLQMLFDLDEDWGLRRGVRLPNVFKHELGHGLGLDHTNTPGQLLQPVYSERIATYQAEDISRLVDRYGPPATQPKPADPPTLPPVPTDIDRIPAKVQINGRTYGGWLTPLAQSLIDGSGLSADLDF